MTKLAIALTIVAQICGRLVGVTIDSTETGGFSLAATTFLGLAYTFKSGTHVRVNLLIRHASGAAARIVELWCTGVGTVAIGYFAWQTVNMVYDSWRFGDLSVGLLAIPIWIPQSAMALGLVILAIAFADEFCRIAAGRIPAYEDAIDTVLEPLEAEGPAPDRAAKFPHLD